MGLFGKRSVQEAPPPSAAAIQAANDQRAHDWAHLLVDEAFPLVDECLQSSGHNGQAGLYAIRGGRGYCSVTTGNWEHLAQAFPVLQERYQPANFTVRLRLSRTTTPVVNGRVGRSHTTAECFKSAKGLIQYMRENRRDFVYRMPDVSIEIAIPGRLSR